MNRRVVITGMGIYSSIGVTLDEVRQSLYTGKSGIVIDQDRIEAGFKSPLTGMVPKPNLKDSLTRRQRISIGEESEYAYLATVQAFEQAKIDQDFLDSTEIGIMYGNDSVSRAIIEANDILREKKDTALIGSGSIFKSMNSTVTMNLSTIFKMRGINLTVSAACASGSHSIGLGFHLIKSGMQDIIVCGGAQEINIYGMASFDALGVFSKYDGDPAKASRPFDVSRDGLIPSGGAATLILEDYESAVKRGAPILAEVIGYGFSSNGGHISTPNIEGPSTAMLRSIEMAGIKADAVDYINAHATSTPVGDSNEAEAIHKIFGERNPHVSSTKSMTGHECWMAGASEVIYSILMMQNSFVAPNINFEIADEQSAKLNIAKNTINEKIDIFLSNSFGFGGTNSALVVKKI